MTDIDRRIPWKDSQDAVMLAYNAETEMTMVSIRDYFETRLESFEKAVTVAQAAMDRRLEGMNEFREQLDKQTSTFITRTEFELVSSKNSQEIRELREFRVEMESKASQASVLVAISISILGLAIGIMSVFMRYRERGSKQ